MTAQHDDDLRTYFEDILKKVARVARELKSDRAPSVRTSDVVQEVCLRMQPQLERGEDPDSLMPLAAKIARCFLIDHARKKRPTPVPLDVLEGARQSLHDSGIDLLCLDEYLGGLSPRNAAVVELRVFAGLEIQEILDLTGDTEHFVRKTLRNAKKHIARVYEVEQ